MRSSRRTLASAFRRIGVFLLSAVAAGCHLQPPGPPFRYPTAEVHGLITCAGQVVSAGWVTLLPIHGTVGDHVVGRIGPNGQFSCPRAPRGRLRVRVELPPTEWDRVGARNIDQAVLFRCRQLIAGVGSPLEIESGDAPTEFRFDLAVTPLPSHD